MEEVEKCGCIICGQEVSTSLSKFCEDEYAKSEIVQSWNDDCATTFCEVLLGDEHLPVFLQYFQNYNFCVNCDQTVRDMHFFVNQIEIFKKRISSLIEAIQSLLLVNFQQSKSRTTKSQRLQTGIMTLLSKGPNCLKLYSYQQIAEIMYSIIANKKSREESEKLRVDSVDVDSTSGTAEMVESETVSDKCEAIFSEVKEEQADYIYDSNNEMDDHFDHLPESPETDVKLPVPKVESKSVTTKMKGKRKQLPLRKTRSMKSMLKNEDESGSESEEEMKPKKTRPPKAKVRYRANEEELDDTWIPQKKYGKPTNKKKSNLKSSTPETKKLSAKEQQEAKHQKMIQYCRDRRLAKKKAISHTCSAENCEQFFRYKDEADGHYREIHEGNTTDAYRCEHCPEKFSNYPPLKRHNKVRKQVGSCLGKQECKFCGKRYITEEELNEHLSGAHQGPNPFSCAFCDKEYTNTLDLRKHVKDCHPNVGEIICDECGKSVLFSKLKTHKAMHARLADVKDDLKCDTCAKTFLSVSAFQGHMRRYHEKNEREKLYCEICGQGCESKSSLNKHMGYHSDLRPYKCNICDRTFKTRNHCKDHETSHTGIRNYKCSTCGKYFLTSNILHGHELTHKEGYVPRKFNRRTKPAKRIITKENVKDGSVEETMEKSEQEQAVRNIENVGEKEEQMFPHGPRDDHSQEIASTSSNEFNMPVVTFPYAHRPQIYYYNPQYPNPHHPNIG